MTRTCQLAGHAVEQLYDARVKADRKKVAAACIAGEAENYAIRDRYGRDQAIQNIQRELKVWKIAPSEAGEVMAKAASNYVDSDAWRADVALQLLVDLGADVERARAIRAARPRPRRFGIGGGGLTEPIPD